ncbi:MAG: hypothetical protein OEV42_20910, partial [Deltaproteobacteria bacterium]|nr:hypothetical protein [Deltaproteobacteria bacterium]
MHSLRYAGDPQKYKNSQELATSTDGKLSGVKVGGVCTTYGCGSNGSDIFLDTIAGPIYQTNVKKIFDQTNKDLFYYWP